MNLFYVWASVGFLGVVLSFLAAIWIISFLLLSPAVWEKCKKIAAADLSFLQKTIRVLLSITLHTVASPFFYPDYFRRKMWEERMFQFALKIL